MCARHAGSSRSLVPPPPPPRLRPRLRRALDGSGGAFGEAELGLEMAVVEGVVCLGLRGGGGAAPAPVRPLGRLGARAAARADRHPGAEQHEALLAHLGGRAAVHLYGRFREGSGKVQGRFREGGRAAVHLYMEKCPPP